MHNQDIFEFVPSFVIKKNIDLNLDCLHNSWSRDHIENGLIDLIILLCTKNVSLVCR